MQDNLFDTFRHGNLLIIVCKHYIMDIYVASIDERNRHRHIVAATICRINRADNHIRCHIRQFAVIVPHPVRFKQTAGTLDRLLHVLCVP